MGRNVKKKKSPSRSHKGNQRGGKSQEVRGNCLIEPY